MIKKRNGGFTLVELLIVIVIIGILATLAVPQYQKMVERSKTAEAYNFMDALRKAECLYYTQFGVFTPYNLPASPDALPLVGQGFIDRVPRTPNQPGGITENDAAIYYWLYIFRSMGGGMPDINSNFEDFYVVAIRTAKGGAQNEGETLWMNMNGKMVNSQEPGTYPDFTP